MHQIKLAVLPISLALTFGLAGCKSNQPAAPAPIVDANNGVDPALANLAPVDPNAPVQPAYSTAAPAQQPARVLGQRQDYPQTAPTTEQYPENDDAYDQYDQQVNAGQDALYADQAPPPLPVYDQPELTQANDQWTPGYWNYGTSPGYYFVPGAWVAPPYAGALWTPGYWGYEGRRYRFHRGFWGRHIGFYGGVNYGFGYYGRGYEGGYWNKNNFFYNDRINRINVNVVRDVYQRNVVIENNTHYSYNGPGGYQTRPVAAELAVYREQRLPPQQVQLQIREQAATNRQQFFAENHGRPAVFVAPQRFNADAQQARPIQPVQRNGFGQQGINNQPQQFRDQAAQQQRQAQQQQVQQQQQRNAQQQQRTAQQQQHNAQQQQQNAQRQQQEQQRSQQLQDRNVQQQQRAQQLQQRNAQQQASQQTAQQQQRVQAQQQRNVQAQQQNAQRQQQVQAQQQRTQQNAQAQQQRGQQEQQRAQQEQQRGQQEQQRAQQQQQRAQPQPQAARPQPQPQAARPQPQPQAARPQPAAPRPAPAAQPEPHGGERPHR